MLTSTFEQVSYFWKSNLEKYLRKNFCQIELKIKITIFFLRGRKKLREKLKINLKILNGWWWGDMVATLDFPWLSFLKRSFKKKTVKNRFFSIQKFNHWSNNTNENMMIWRVFFLKGSWCLKSEYTMILLTTLESQGLFNNYFCHQLSPKILLIFKKPSNFHAVFSS